MNDDFHDGREDTHGGHSQFPAVEPKSYCSRPTPVVPARGDLLGFRADSFRPDAVGSNPAPGVNPSSRPTLTPEDLGIPSPVSGSFSGAEAESFPALEPGSLAPVASVVHRVEPPSTAPPVVEIGPVVSLEPAPEEAPAPVLRSAPRWRLLFARLLFVILFGCVTGLLGYAFRTQLTHALREAPPLAK